LNTGIGRLGFGDWNAEQEGLAVAKAPARQIYIKDWLSDEKLGRCRPETRGIWMDVICHMHQDGGTGVFRATPEELMRLCRCTSAELERSLIDLKKTKAANVTRRNGNVTLTNRRLQREHKNVVANRLRQRKHRQKGT